MFFSFKIHCVSAAKCSKFNKSLYIFLKILFIDQPIENGKTPTEAHSGLKTLIDALVEEVNDDDEFQVYMICIFMI